MAPQLQSGSPRTPWRGRPATDPHELSCRAYQRATGSIRQTQQPNPLERLFQHIDLMRENGATRADVRALEVAVAEYADAAYGETGDTILDLLRRVKAHARRAATIEFEYVAGDHSPRELALLADTIREFAALDRELLAELHRGEA